MIRLAIIFFLMSMVESENSMFTLHQLKELKEIFDDEKREMEKATQSQSKNALIVIGPARGGKSTLINYLIGNALEAYHPNKFEPMKLKLTDNNNKGPKIFAGTVSGTSIPSKWNSRRSEFQNFDIWDSAGFGDNRNNMIDLSNAFYLYHLTRNVEKLKLILVISYKDINTDNVDNIRQLFRVLQKYFADGFRSFFPSISIIISKAPKVSFYGDLIDIEYITDILRKKLLLNSEMSMSQDSKDFVNYIIDNKENLAIFREAKHEGSLTSEINVNILPAIINCKAIIKSSHQNIGIPMSDESERCLRAAIAVLLPLNAIIELENALFNLFDEKFAALCLSSDNKTLQTNKDILNTIDQSFNTQFSNNPVAEDKIKVLKTMSDDFKNIIETNDTLKKIALTRFTDFLLKQDIMKSVDTSVNGIVDSIQVKIKSCLTTCSRKLKEIEDDEYQRRQDEDAKNRQRILNIAQANIANLPKTENEESGWQKFLRKLARFLDLDGNPMTMG